MKIKNICNKMECVLKDKFQDMPVEIYYSRRRKHIHFAFNEQFNKFERKKEFLKEIEKLYNELLKKDFEFLNPMRIIQTIKWKFDYIVFRKR